MIRDYTTPFICGIFVLLTIASSGCQKGVWYVDPIDSGPPPRIISMSTFGLNWPPVFEEIPAYYAEETVGFQIQVFGEVGGEVASITQLASKVEVDPGDGAGWLDFTQGWKDTFKANGERYSGTHVYQVPGDYSQRLRVTYWDGEELGDTSSSLITILPAPDPSE